MAQISDFTLPVNLVRLLIADLDDTNQVFNDEAIQAMLDVHNGIGKLAAADLLMVMAINEVLVQKRIKIGDLSTDGPSEAIQLRQLSKKYRDEALADDEIGFDWAEMVLTPAQEIESRVRDGAYNEFGP